ncbi:MAG: FxsA family protein [Alphaproteobacteria bacterium]|nr:FxsA family protein [Alphaproteobacteria bacterium]
MPFFAIFVLVPLAEIIVFFAVSDEIGIGTALLLALFTAVLGGAIVRYQGIQTLMKAQEAIAQGELPSKELFDGLCLIASGATLITPGFITDTIGFLLLIPGIRDWLRHKAGNMTHFQSTTYSSNYTNFHEPYRSHDPNVIDVEYETVKEEEKP